MVFDITNNQRDFLKTWCSPKTQSKRKNKIIAWYGHPIPHLEVAFLLFIADVANYSGNLYAIHRNANKL